MTRKSRFIHGALVGAALASWGQAQAGDGCGWCKQHWLRVDNCATIPKGAQPAPVGTYVHMFMKIQETNAEADDFVIYKHMWYKGGTELGPMGRYQLEQICRRLPTVPFPVVVATSQNDHLDEMRRETVVRLLASRGMLDPTRVIVAYPIAEGLIGEEGPRVLQGILNTGYGNPYYGGFGGPGFPGLYGGGFFGGFR
jgi:hypothetical protein